MRVPAWLKAKPRIVPFGARKSPNDLIERGLPEQESLELRGADDLGPVGTEGDAAQAP